MRLQKFKITAFLICLHIVSGERDFNFSEDSQAGCTDSFFSTDLPVFNQVPKKSFDVSSKKEMEKRLQRNKREIDGSGEDYDQYDYDDEITESVTENPSFPTHAHRHHHGIAETVDVFPDERNTKSYDISNELESSKIVNTDVLKIDEEIIKGVSKLESDISKTIENTKNIKESGAQNFNGNGKNSYSSLSGKEGEKIKGEKNLKEVHSTLANVSEIKKSNNKINFSDIKYKNDDTKTTTSYIKEELISEKQPSVISTISLANKILEKQESFGDTKILMLKNVEEVETNTINSITLVNGTLMSQEPVENKVTASTGTTIASTDASLNSDEILDYQNQTIIETIVDKIESSPIKKEREKDITTVVNTSIPFISVQQVSTEEPHPEDLDISTVIPTTELYLTSVDTETSSIANNITQATQVSSFSVGTSTKFESTTILSSTFSNIEYEEPKSDNTAPTIKTRLRKYTSVSGKLFRYKIPTETFYDNEDGYNLKLEFLDKNGELVKATSWIQFDENTREIYGLPMEDTVSKWQYRLRATDSGNESITELVEMFVYQHKGLRSVNHEINIQVEILDDNMRKIDWQLMIIQNIANILDNRNTSNVVVRDILYNQENPRSINFTYFNESLPTGYCPEKELNDMIKGLHNKKFSELLSARLHITNVSGKLIGSCLKQQTIVIAKNYPPVPRNQVDRVNATVGYLLVYKVPDDTFYDPNDNTNLKLSLLTMERKTINQRHWLQFDSRNKEFYGIPKSGDVGSEEFLLVAEDNAGLTATDALVVVVNHASKRDYSVYFKAYLAIPYEQFNVNMQRKFVERISQLFNDNVTNYIQIRSITTHHDSVGTIVNFYNTTLYKTQNSCPEEKIELVRNVYFVQDFLLRDKIKKFLGSDFNLTNLQIVSLGLCNSILNTIHKDTVPVRNEQPDSVSTFTDDYLFTCIVPAAIILTMIILAAIIACFLHRRRITGKMELGDEEERKSFRPKGIPVIFQDELDEKPEIGNKSPIILKDEKPPLLPPSYNQSNLDGENEVDEYVPPPAVIVGGREIRGKSPATPSYRKPPPYVSP